jgi:spermidine synthase
MPQYFVENLDPSIHFEVTEVLLNTKTDFQSLQVLDTKNLGKVMVLDDCVMITQKDEFVYHEMIAHIPVCYHESPKTVVVIGGGDGGTVRELVKHKEIEKVILCEIDAGVIDAAKKFFPEVACGLEDPRVEVRVGDGIAYMKTLENEVDIVLVDSTDPVGPGEGLFTKEFYQSVKRALKSDGIMTAQSESPWLEKEFLLKIKNNIAAGFDHIKPYIGSVPTYPMGLWSWTMASNVNLDSSRFNKERFSKVSENLQYLTTGMASNAFELPPFYRKKLEGE